MDPRPETLERGSAQDLYRVLRHLELHPGEVSDELLRAVTGFAMERLAWLHAFFSGGSMDASPFPPGGEVNWMDVRGWAMMALDVLSALDPTLGKFSLNMPDPLIDTYGRWFGDLNATDFDRAPGSRKVVEEAVERLYTSSNPDIAAAAARMRTSLNG